MKGFFGMFFRSSPAQNIDHYEEIMKFRILCTLYRKENEQYILESKNTEIVFDKLNNTIYDFIMIIRKHRVSKNYNDVVYMRDGDYYFNISFLKTITKSELNNETEEFSINLIDQEKIEWDIRLHFKKSSNFDINQLNLFTDHLLKLLWVNKNTSTIDNLPQNMNLDSYLIKKQLEPLKIKEILRQKAKLNKKQLDKNILQQRTKRVTAEKEQIGDALNYFLSSSDRKIKQLFSGQLYALENEEVVLLNSIVIAALNFASKKDCRFEIYNINRQILLIQPISEYVNFTLQTMHSYLSWTYVDGNNFTSVLYFKFDTLDGAETMSNYLHQSRLQFQNQQIDKQQLQNFGMQITQQQQKQAHNVQNKKLVSYQDQINTKSNIKIAGISKILLCEANNMIILTNNSIWMLKNNEMHNLYGISATQYDSAFLSQNCESILLFKQFTTKVVLIDLINKNEQSMDCQKNIIDATSTRNSDQFLLISPDQIFLLTKIIKNIYQLKDSKQDNFSKIICSKHNAIILGTLSGRVYLFDDIESMKLTNIIPSFGDSIKDLRITNSSDYLLINNGPYMLIQQIKTSGEDGLKQTFSLTPFPIKIEIIPEDLLMLGIFDIPKFELMRVDEQEMVLIAQINNVQIIWNLAQLKNRYTDLYEIKIMDESLQDQEFCDLDIVMIDQQIKLRHPNY